MSSLRSPACSLPAPKSYPWFPLCFLEDPVHFLNAGGARVTPVIAVPMAGDMRAGIEKVPVPLLTGISLFFH